MGVEYTSPGGTRHFYGPRLSPATNPDSAGAKESTYGNIVELEYRYTYDNLPAYSADAVNDASTPIIPAGSLILSCYREIEVAFDSTSGTTVSDVGLTDTDGNVLDADGLVDSAVAADGTSEDWEVGAGALIEATTSADAVVVVGSSVNDLTAGRARLVIQFIPPSV